MKRIASFAVLAMLAAAAQAKAVLTDEQRTRVERWAGTMMGHH